MVDSVSVFRWRITRLHELECDPARSRPPLVFVPRTLVSALQAEIFSALRAEINTKGQPERASADGINQADSPPARRAGLNERQGLRG